MKSRCTNPSSGLFPHPSEIKLNCSCPDWADMCKHVAAVLYGVGARLDNKPEELFLLRQADHIELIAVAGTASIAKTTADHSDEILANTDLSSLFGIEMESTAEKNTPQTIAVKKNKSTSPAKIAKKRIAPSAEKKESKKIKTKVNKRQVMDKIKALPLLSHFHCRIRFRHFPIVFPWCEANKVTLK